MSDVSSNSRRRVQFGLGTLFLLMTATAAWAALDRWKRPEVPLFGPQLTVVLVLCAAIAFFFRSAGRPINVFLVVLIILLSFALAANGVRFYLLQ
jgi:hypothetical protein